MIHRKIDRVALAVASMLISPLVFAGVNEWENSGPPAWVTALAVDPGPVGTVYAATPGSLYRSSDHGKTWAMVGVHFAEDHFITALAVDPTNGATLYVAFEREGGVFKSTDAGETLLPSGAGLPFYCTVEGIAVSPSDPSTPERAGPVCPSITTSTV